MFNDNNPNVLKQKAIFGEASYKVTPALKVTAGLRFYKFDISNNSNQRGLGTGIGKCHTDHRQRGREQYQSVAEGQRVVRTHSGSHAVQHASPRVRAPAA